MTTKEPTTTSGAREATCPTRDKKRCRFDKPLTAALLVGAAICATGIIAFAKELKHVRGGAAGTVNVTQSENDASLFTIHFSGTGTLTHIGRFEFVLDCLAMVDSEGNPSRVPGTTAGTITTANGDQIFFTVNWICRRDGDQIHGTGTVTAQAGTGRFAQVTVSGEFDTVANLGTRQMTAAFTGVVATK